MMPSFAVHSRQCVMSTATVMRMWKGILDMRQHFSIGSYLLVKSVMLYVCLQYGNQNFFETYFFN